ncbi:hypothetical protein CDO27_14475 [Sinorhizobium meliloti]|nr:hypothetical protein CDO27_14475 [Sinorhizobium meliloti]ASP93074.1 hypothetical protein CDO25_02600 [Sinorhizobium meliloti]QGJ75918.1 hypothetical protein C3L21_02550 [Sinorhizobium meliloti]
MGGIRQCVVVAEGAGVVGGDGVVVAQRVGAGTGDIGRIADGAARSAADGISDADADGLQTGSHGAGADCDGFIGARQRLIADAHRVTDHEVGAHGGLMFALGKLDSRIGAYGDVVIAFPVTARRIADRYV